MLGACLRVVQAGTLCGTAPTKARLLPPRHPRLPAALHVAAATGRADVVRQLAASGAAIDKPLPMDYRALVRQRAGGARAGASSDGSAPAAAHDDSAAAEAAGAAGGLGPEGLCDDAGDSGVPPPKRGRYVTAGPADPGPPSLQYCTALHLAALQGQLEAVQALLATGQVRAACRGGRGGQVGLPGVCCRGPECEPRQL